MKNFCIIVSVFLASSQAMAWGLGGWGIRVAAMPHEQQRYRIIGFNANVKHTMDFIYYGGFMQKETSENGGVSERFVVSIDDRFKPWKAWKKGPDGSYQNNYTNEEVSLNTGRDRVKIRGYGGDISYKLPSSTMRLEHLPEKFLPVTAIGPYPYDQEYWTPLMWLIAVHKPDKQYTIKGDLLIVFSTLLDFFISNPFLDINMKTRDGRSALMLAIKLGYDDVVEKLINRKVMVNEKEVKKGKVTSIVPVYKACTPGVDFVPVRERDPDNIFNEADTFPCADVNISDRIEKDGNQTKGNSALHYAIKRLVEGQKTEKDDGKRASDLKSMTRIIDILLAAKANRETVDDEGYTAFHLAISEGLTDVAQKIFAADYPIEDDSAEMVREKLLESLPNKAGDLPLTTAAKNCDASGLRFFIANGVDMAEPKANKESKTPINYAINSSNDAAKKEKCMAAVSVLLNESQNMYKNPQLRAIVRAGKGRSGLYPEVEALILDKHDGTKAPLQPNF